MALAQVRQTPPRSVFDCFAAYQFYFGGHSVKSLHLGLACPLTGYHHACMPTACRSRLEGGGPHCMHQSPRAYDCACEVVSVR